ncbi:DUF3352 domain-containing protein [Pedococcus bigeumensis]|uniref:DUF3352 domain-containing protein n=1 Tax=Pedococcus bigeumensis TaxID=433644 RepID=A0A502CZ26_9MICO|nr:DUF3352 domain-containing protein [Pedococcus bigeumensis]TPG17076.1 DUF3352 domain-containing protein [Pedococcus bigeumensis]
MSTPENLFEPPVRHTAPSEAAVPSGAAVPQEQPRPAGGRGRTIALVGGILAIVAVGAGGAVVFNQVSGGGAQPESVMPGTTIAFAKVDLDPAAGQKLDAIRFVRRFPAAEGKVKDDSDLREVIIKALEEDGQLKGIDYAKDIEPWLGQRIGVGAVPGADGSSKPTVVVALAVTDKGKAEASLPKLTDATGGACQVLEAYAVCTDTTKKLAGVVSATAKGTLADSTNFAKDMAELGEDGVAASWFDAGKADGLLGGASGGLFGAIPGSLMGASPSSTGGVGKGRVAVALRFDGPHLELAGHTSGGTTSFAGKATASSIEALPKDTLAAVTVANAGDQLKAGWPELEKGFKSMAGDQEFTDGLAQAQDALGIKLPDDLYAALGSQFSVAFGGLGADASDLKVAVVSNGDKAVLQKLADSAGELMGSVEPSGGGALTLKSAGDRTVVSLTDDYADEIASGSGLGDTAGFKEAVKDSGKAQIVGYVDIAGLLTAFKDEVPADEAKNLGALSALGFSVTGDGGSSDFSLRLTTK